MLEALRVLKKCRPKVLNYANSCRILNSILDSSLFSFGHDSPSLIRLKHKPLRKNRFNHYLRESGSDLQVWSFGAELADCVAYCTLFNAIDSSACPPPDPRDAEVNASNVVIAVQKMEIKVGWGICCRGGGFTMGE